MARLAGVVLVIQLVILAKMAEAVAVYIVITDGPHQLQAMAGK